MLQKEKLVKLLVKWGEEHKDAYYRCGWMQKTRGTHPQPDILLKGKGDLGRASSVRERRKKR